MIYYFGDSHTHGMGYLNKLMEYEYNPYPYYLSEKLNMSYINLAKPGNNLVQNVNILTQNLKNIIDNGKIVIFQFQFFHNAFFKFDNADLQWKDFVIHGEEKIEDVMGRTNLSIEDSILLINYLDKFEERRSWYEMERVYSIFNFLKKYNIRCYALYWCEPKLIDIIEDRRNILFDNQPYVKGLKILTTIKDDTNGLWDDGHYGNDSNKLIAEKIHTYILENSFI